MKFGLVWVNWRETIALRKFVTYWSWRVKTLKKVTHLFWNYHKVYISYLDDFVSSMCKNTGNEKFFALLDGMESDLEDDIDELINDSEDDIDELINDSDIWIGGF